MGFKDEQDQRLKFRVYEQLQPWVYEQELAVNNKMSWVSMGFKEEDEQKE